MIFIDSNIPIYLVGASHPHKVDAQRILEQSIAAGNRLVTDAEVLQEILHRYAALGRTDAIQPAFDAVLGVVDEVLPVGLLTSSGQRRLSSSRGAFPPGMLSISQSWSDMRLRGS